jgi:transcriptional regulator with XRE-family HTH domain
VKHLAKLLGHYRLLERKTVREVASEIGISASTLSRIEHNELMDGATLALILAWITQIDRKEPHGSTEDPAGHA